MAAPAVTGTALVEWDFMAYGLGLDHLRVKTIAGAVLTAAMWNEMLTAAGIEATVVDGERISQDQWTAVLKIALARMDEQ